MRVLTYLHLHPFEGFSVLLVERSSHHYPVDSPRAHVGPFSSTALMLSQRYSQRLILWLVASVDEPACRVFGCDSSQRSLYGLH